MNAPAGRDDDEGDPFTVWPKTGSTLEGHVVRALSARQAAERKARADWIASWANSKISWPLTYCVRDDLRGTVWEVDVTIVPSPSFVACADREVELPAALHVLRHGVTLCEDLRLRGAPVSWPAGHRWISLEDAAAVAAGSAPPWDTTAAPDRCEECWAKVPEHAEELKRQRDY